jgi:hypothetical protein
VNPSDRLAPNFLAVELVAMTEPGPERDARWAVRSQLVTPPIAHELRRLAWVLQVIRNEVGGAVRITSGLRAGNGKSQHHHGQAADIQVDGVSPLALIALIHRHRAPMKLRQVIAETTGDEASLSLPMGKGTGRWVHVAIMGETAYNRPSGDPWMTCHRVGGSDLYRAWEAEDHPS